MAFVGAGVGASRTKDMECQIHQTQKTRRQKRSVRPAVSAWSSSGTAIWWTTTTKTRSKSSSSHSTFFASASPRAPAGPCSAGSSSKSSTSSTCTSSSSSSLGASSCIARDLRGRSSDLGWGAGAQNSVIDAAKIPEREFQLEIRALRPLPARALCFSFKSMETRL